MGKKKRSNTISIFREDSSRKNHNVVPGRIYWLPEKDDHDIELLESTSIDDGCFGHPVVVLGVDKTRKIAIIFIITSLGGKRITRYADRRKYLAISPAENPDNTVKLFLDDGFELEKNSYVTTVTQHRLSWKMLKPYWHRPSGKQYCLRADSQVELLKYADLSSLLVIVSKGVMDVVPVPPLDSRSSNRRLLAPLSGNAVRSYETDIERHAGWPYLPSRQEAQQPSISARSTVYDNPTLPQPGTYHAWVHNYAPSSTRHNNNNHTLPQPATHPAWVNNYAPSPVSYWQITQHVHQPVPGAYSPPLRSSFNERSALLPAYSSQPLHEHEHEQGDSEPVTTGSSWWTKPRVILALLGVVAIGYFSFVRK